MKTRKFDIKNYNITSKVRKDLVKQFENTKFHGVDVSEAISISNWHIPKELKKYDKDYQNEIIAFFKEEYKIKKEQTIKEYNNLKKYIDKILFDDKDYIELCEVLKGNYYCQAITMLNDLLDKKTKGKTIKAMKYQARVLQIKNQVNCD